MSAALASVAHVATRAIVRRCGLPSTQRDLSFASPAEEGTYGNRTPPPPPVQGGSRNRSDGTASIHLTWQGSVEPGSLRQGGVFVLALSRISAIQNRKACDRDWLCNHMLPEARIAGREAFPQALAFPKTVPALALRPFGSPAGIRASEKGRAVGVRPLRRPRRQIAGWGRLEGPQ